MPRDKSKNDREAEIERMRIELALLRADKLRDDLFMLAESRRKHMSICTSDFSQIRAKERALAQPLLLLTSPIEPAENEEETMTKAEKTPKLEDVISKLSGRRR